jgi:hypothetical protein
MSEEIRLISEVIQIFLCCLNFTRYYFWLLWLSLALLWSLSSTQLIVLLLTDNELHVPRETIRSSRNDHDSVFRNCVSKFSQKKIARRVLKFQSNSCFAKIKSEPFLKSSFWWLLILINLEIVDWKCCSIDKWISWVWFQSTFCFAQIKSETLWKSSFWWILSRRNLKILSSKYFATYDSLSSIWFSSSDSWHELNQPHLSKASFFMNLELDQF